MATVKRKGRWITTHGVHVWIRDPGSKPLGQDLPLKTLERIDTRAKTIETLPPIRSAKGETITVSVQTNPFHPILHRAEGVKRFRVLTHVDGSVNDSRQFTSLDKASKYAKSWHRAMMRDEARGRKG